MGRMTMAFRSGAFLGHLDRDFRAIGLGKPRLVLEPRGHDAVAVLMRIAEFVEIEQFRRERLVARQPLAFAFAFLGWLLRRSLNRRRPIL